MTFLVLKFYIEFSIFNDVVYCNSLLVLVTRRLRGAPRAAEPARRVHSLQ